MAAGAEQAPGTDGSGGPGNTGYPAGLAPSDPRLGAAVARHYPWVCAGWTPDRAAYKGLGELYVQDSRFTAFYNSEAAGPVAYLAEASGSRAEANL